jgi:hypothetical protein
MKSLYVSSIILLVILIAACTQPVVVFNVVEKVEQSTNLADLKMTLDTILHRHTNTRALSTKYARENGRKSSIFREAENQVYLTDENNIAAIKLLLEKYGYPDSTSVGKQRALIPWIVVRNYYQVHTKEQLQSYLLEGLKKGSISNYDYYLYLKDIYSLKFKKEFIPEESWSDSMKIQVLNDTLSYRPI